MIFCRHLMESYRCNLLVLYRWSLASASKQMVSFCCDFQLRNEGGDDFNTNEGIVKLHSKRKFQETKDLRFVSFAQK